MNGIGDAIGGAIGSLFIIAVVGLVMMPLGIWKLIEIIIWACKHIHWS